MKSLTAAFVKSNLKKGLYGDGNTLYLNVEASGSKNWIQKVTVKGFKRIELGLGGLSYVTLAQAREKASHNRILAKQGIDPRTQSTITSSVPSFSEAARRTHQEFKHTWSNPKDQNAFISTLERYVFPKFGDNPVDQVKSSDVRQAILATREKAPSVAKKLVYRIKLVFKWAIAEGYCETNPALPDLLALPISKHKVKHRKSLAYDKVSHCIDVIHLSNAGLTTKLAIEFIILTATRSSEARKAVWDEFDLLAEHPTWTVPATRMKMKREHRIPLSNRAVEILQIAREIKNESSFVFCGMKSDRPLSDMTLSKLVKEQGFDVDVHGFRTSFRTWTQEQTDYTPEVCEAALAHSQQSSVEAAYARSDLFEKRAALMQDWANYLKV